MGVEPDQERDPPASPTPLEFPQYVGFDGEDIQRITDFNAIYRNLIALRKPQDITIDHVKALNLRIETDIEGLQIISDEDLQGLPPLVWDKMNEDDDENPSEAPKMGNGIPYPPYEKYDIVKKELLSDTDDAFREAARMPPKPGRDRVRLTQTRKFWLGLERIAQYWDTSQDEYFERPAAASKPEENQTVNDERASTNTGVDSPMDTSASPAEEIKTYERVYKGRRIGTGSEMPADIREDTMRGLLEMVAWPFQCQVSVPSLPPRLHTQGLLFPVRLTLISGRVPQDRQAARSGILQGPLLGVQCREETKFSAKDEEPGSWERARDGAVEVRPGEGKWWTTVPRFGGAEHEGVTGEAANADDAKTKEDQKDDDNNQGVYKRSRYMNPLIASRRAARARRLTPSEKWNIIGPGTSLWDKKMNYMQIGKPNNSPYDDIYMLSSINHHVSILHLRVHRRYIDCLTSGVSDDKDQGTTDQPWNELKLRRPNDYGVVEDDDSIFYLPDITQISGEVYK
uniref:UvrABC system protein B n=1 Tax=Talaromyces marneffei PM1 TaxID=1077442 RepID=A0A093V5M5_TALMA